MKAPNLNTTNPNVNLVEPALERDAKLGVVWINNQQGHDTLKLMGVADKDNKPTTLEQERRRVQEFITNPSQLNWMVSYNSQIVGSIWVDLKSMEYLESPSVHIMLGDPIVRKQGVGSAAIGAVINNLKQQGHKQIYSRYLLQNNGSQKLLYKAGFTGDDEPYKDSDGLKWQNVIRIIQ